MTLAVEEANSILDCIKRGQQVEGGDSTPLHHSHMNPSGVPHPALGSSAQERYGPVWPGPEEDHENNQRDGAPLLWKKAERAGVVQPGEEKALGRPYHGLSIYLGGFKNDGEKLFTAVCTERTRDKGFKLKELD